MNYKKKIHRLSDILPVANMGRLLFDPTITYYYSFLPHSSLRIYKNISVSVGNMVLLIHPSSPNAIVPTLLHMLTLLLICQRYIKLPRFVLSHCSPNILLWVLWHLTRLTSKNNSRAAILRKLSSILQINSPLPFLCGAHFKIDCTHSYLTILKSLTCIFVDCMDLLTRQLSKIQIEHLDASSNVQNSQIPTT